MKKHFGLSVILIIFLFTNCAKNTKPVITDKTAKPTSEKCAGVPTLTWQKEVQGADAESAAKLVTQAAIAAKADAKQSESLKGSGSLDASIKSELSRVINENVSKESKVPEEFWVQELTFTRLYCLSLYLLDRPDLSKEMKDKITDDIRSMQNSEAVYALNAKKKIGTSQK